jgi:hypothetical protein
MKSNKLIWLCTAVVACMSISACKKASTALPLESAVQTSSVTYTTEMVLRWNLVGTTAVLNSGSIPPYPPMIESRIYAMLNVGMHDALNTIDPRYERYALKIPVQADADADAAVAQAAHDILVALIPSQKQVTDSLLTVSLESITSANKDAGIVVGKAAAEAMLLKRASDGASTAQIPYIQGTIPGAYRSTPPFDMPPYNGYVAVPAWGSVTPFGITSGSQFRADPPYTVTSKEYAADYNEILKLGCKDSKTRTKDQTEIALFWLDNVPLSWNRITRDMVVKYKLDAWDAAHLLSLVEIAEADANIASFDTKFKYNFWRPITAIHLGDTDGNPDTKGDPTWNVLAPPTPPVPDYTSNHSADGAAAAEVLKNYFKTDNVSFSTTSAYLPGVTRNFTTFTQAADEVAASRVYVGYHFRTATKVGEAQGRKVGKYVFENSLPKL